MKRWQRFMRTEYEELRSATFEDIPAFRAEERRFGVKPASIEEIRALIPTLYVRHVAKDGVKFLIKSVIDKHWGRCT